MRGSAPSAAGRSPRPVKYGLVALLFGLALMSLPLLLVAFTWNKYFVAFGFVSACVGLSFIIHGVWDWLSDRRE